MLEQFRIFHAALRLGKFTSKQLSEASGVAEGTVQKTLRRRKDLFITMKGLPTKKRGGQSLLHVIRDDVLRTALQQAADAVDMPPLPTKETGEPLGLILAEETLCKVLPRAQSHERPALLSAALTNLALAGSSHVEAVADLRRLAEALSVLSNAQIRLLDPKIAELDSAARDVSLGAIESLLSLEERNLRDEDSARRERTMTALASLPSALAELCRSVWKDEPGPPWWTEVVAAEWALLAHTRWQPVVGDIVADRVRKEEAEAIVVAEARENELTVAEAEVVRYTVQQPAPIPAVFPIEPAATVVAGAVVLGAPRVGRLAGLIKTTGERMFGRAMKVGPRVGDAMTGRGVPRAPDFFSSGEQHSGIRVTIDARDFRVYDSARYFGGLMSGHASDDRAIGTVAAIELDFMKYAVSSVTLDTGMGIGGTVFVPYRELQLVEPSDDDFTRYAWTVDSRLVKRWMSPLDPEINIRAIVGPDKVGTAQWFDLQNMRILLNPGHQIAVLDGSPRSHYLRMGESSGKIGDLIAVLVHVESGTLSGAVIKMADQHALQLVSFSTLQYRPNERCFVVTSPDVEQPPWSSIQPAESIERYRELD